MSRVFISLFVLFGLTTVAGAESTTLESAGVQFDPPPGWKVSKGDDGVYELAAELRSVVFRVAVVAVKDVKDAKARVGAELTKLVVEPKLSKPIKHEQNGLEGVRVLGRGVAGGNRVEVIALLLHSPKGPLVMVFGYGTPGMADGFKKATTAFLKSVKPVAIKAPAPRKR